MLRLLVGLMFMVSGKPLAVLFGVAEASAGLMGIINLGTARKADASRCWWLIPLAYASAVLLSPKGEADSPLLLGLMALLVVWQLWGQWSLGRSMTCGSSTWVGLRDTGPYRVIRHPLLLITVLLRAVFLLGYPTLGNFAVCGAFALAMVAVVYLEESFLQREPAYADYMSRVRWRMVPGVW